MVKEGGRSRSVVVCDTPRVDVREYHMDRPVYFSSEEDLAIEAELMLRAISGIVSLGFGEYSLAVRKATALSWDDLDQQITTYIARNFYGVDIDSIEVSRGINSELEEIFLRGAKIDQITALVNLAVALGLEEILQPGVEIEEVFYEDYQDGEEEDY